MVQRVTNNQTITTFIEQIFQNRVALEDKRQEISTGMKTVAPSDDPGRAGTIASLQNTVHRIRRHQERIGFAQNMLEVQETTMMSVNEVMMRARELATQAANETHSSDVRNQMADEVFQLRDQLVSFANTKYQGMYLYSGKADQNQPFNENNAFYANPGGAAPFPPEQVHWQFDTTITGITEVRSVQITDTDNVRVITRGDELFENCINSLERLGRALKGYRTEPTAGGAPNGAGTAYNLPQETPEQTAEILVALDEIEAARTGDIERELSSLGSRLGRLEQVNNILESVKINTEKSRANLQDSDIFQAASEFSQLQTSLEGLMASGMRINALSLLNFI